MFCLAVSSMLIMIDMDLAPALLCEKSQFLRPMTISLTARSALLLDSSRRPSFRTFMNLSMCFMQYWKAVPSLPEGNTEIDFLEHQSENFSLIQPD